MARNSKRILFSIASIGLLFSAYFFLSAKKTDHPQEISATDNRPIQIEKKEETRAEEAKNIPTEKTESPAPEVPAKFLLQIPFYSQAPLGNWDAIHEEMCEEASLLNAGLFLQDKKLSSADYDRELLKMKDLGKKTVGTWVSTTVADTKKVSDTYFAGKIKSKIIDDPTIADIEAEIAAGHPVIVPLAGREIGNPNFTPPGPVYHMLVAKGYDAQNFITNDVGTRKGDSYVYKKEVIMEKMRDWNAKDIHLGAKKLLVLYK